MEMTMAKVAFIGLGVMGYPMAGHLARAGHDVTVFNRTQAKAEKWVAAYKGAKAPTPRAAARDADFVFACVGNDDDLRSITTGNEGAFAGMKKGAVFVDHTTASAQVARELAGAAAGQGLHFLDAPVSGGQAGAEKGQLTVMAGGDGAVYARAEPVMQSYAKAVQHMGDAGSGQLAKMVNQICIAGVVQGLSEGVAFAQAAGLDIGRLFAAISKGGAGSWQMENRMMTMAEDKFDFGFAVDWIRKDLGICLDEAARNGASLPGTALIDQFYADVQRMGGGRWDSSSLVRRLRPVRRAT
ncbi:MAG: NAD(P)-dependent oxidoreductase [Alphaproteobacteria bacterium]|nr:NAD(P)-dependent oxidoreductase [Alphaproteobacteria bacterium]